MKIYTSMLIKRKHLFVLVAAVVLAVAAFMNFTFRSAAERIVSVNGTISEIVCAIGLESSIVGVDVTSTYPASLQKLPKLGHNKNISTEGVLSLSPSVIMAVDGDLKSETVQQFSGSGAKMKIFKQDFSVEGTKKLIREVAAYFNLSPKGELLIQQLDKDLLGVKKPAVKKKVLFIYARGSGSMMVGGKGTPVEKMIELAGGQNAVTDFSDYKPLTAEALIAANPDIILMFNSGLESMGGVDGLLKVQGIAQTNAGKNKKIISMDGQLLVGFGPRLGKALTELSSKLQ